MTIEKKIKGWVVKDRTYLLAGGASPLTWTVSTRHKSKAPLLYFNEETGSQKEIRYASNQNSLFVEEQKGTVTLEHVVFQDGVLVIPKEKKPLQQLMSIYHPHAGNLWYEHDTDAIAKDDLADIEIELEAMQLVATLDIEHLEAILRTEVGSGVVDMSSKEIKRDCFLFARNNPDLFINVANDEDIKLRNLANRSVEAGILDLTDEGTIFRFKANGKKVMTVPFDQHPYAALAQYFKTDDGVAVMKSIIKKLG